MGRTPSESPLATYWPVVPWNKGAFVEPKPPLKLKQVWAIRLNLQREQRLLGERAQTPLRGAL